MPVQGMNDALAGLQWCGGCHLASLHTELARLEGLLIVRAWPSPELLHSWLHLSSECPVVQALS